MDHRRARHGSDTATAVQRGAATSTGVSRVHPLPSPGLAPRSKQTRLDLLPILHELLRSRSVTQTARTLGITQPTVSHALRRLRDVFDDDPLVSLGRDLRLTARAEPWPDRCARCLSGLANCSCRPGRSIRQPKTCTS